MTQARLTRAERQAQTRARLLASAAEVFAESGFNGASVESIAERAGYTRGAFYSNFEDKADVFLALVDERLARGVGEVSEIMRSATSMEETMSGLRARGERQGVDEAWILLKTEFQLYAIRNPRARAKLAARARSERDALGRAIAYQFDAAGLEPPVPIELLAIMLQVLDGGCEMEHLIDRKISSEVFFDAMSLLLDASLALARSPATAPR